MPDVKPDDPDATGTSTPSSDALPLAAVAGNPLAIPEPLHADA